VRIPILDVALCAASLLAVTAMVAVYASPMPDLHSLEAKIAQSSASLVVDDAMLSSKVQAVLGADPQTASLRIAVDAKDGVVSLAGAVPNADVGAHVMHLVAAIEGVRDVKNSLRIVAAA
jgi:hyperosmotically inducible periplasmic protein